MYVYLYLTPCIVVKVSRLLDNHSFLQAPWRNMPDADKSCRLVTNIFYGEVSKFYIVIESRRKKQCTEFCSIISNSPANYLPKASGVHLQ